MIQISYHLNSLNDLGCEILEKHENKITNHEVKVELSKLHRFYSQLNLVLI